MRITMKTLEARLAHLNELAGFSAPKYSDIGAYCLSGAYGGVALHKYTNNAGGITDIFNQGHMPKKELYGLMSAYISGIETDLKG